MDEDTEDLGEVIRNARAELEEARVEASLAEMAADRLAEEIGEFRVDTNRRLSPFRQVGIAVVGVLFATMMVLVGFVQAAARCAPGDGGVCAAVAPESEGSSAVVQDLLIGTLKGVEFVERGGTVDDYLALTAAGEEARATGHMLLETVVADDGGTELRIAWVSPDHPSLETAGDTTGMLAAEAFPGDAEEELRLRVIEAIEDQLGFLGPRTLYASGADAAVRVEPVSESAALITSLRFN